MRTPREVSESYWAAECRRDVDAVMAHYHADATYQDAGGLLRGHAEIRQFYEASARDYPGLEVTILREFPGSADASAVRDGKFTSVRCYEDPPSAEPPGGRSAP